MVKRAPLFLLFLAVLPAFAWGPHTEITSAALDTLPERDRWKKHFGDDWPRLARDYCWMGDWQEAVRPDHYADDYLLFPSSPSHVSHLLPTVRQTYAPFFKRALQAVRTESPRNAARWIGSLLHFVQDSGSPPHTTGIGGELHGKMERWVDESQIKLGDYSPRLLGKTDDEALRGFLDRMEGLIEFSKVRSLKLKSLVEKLTERVNQPLRLESALETSRVSADVVHTLLTLGLAEPKTPGCTLEGKLAYAPLKGYAQVPAKIILANTDYSTTTDVDGSYRFRNLPAGRYTVWFLATRYETKQVADVVVKAGETTTLSPKLEPDALPGNLIRNPRLELRWIKPGQPDGWTRDPVKNGRWASALIRVPLEQTCRVRIEFVPGKETPVFVRWRANPSSATDSREELLDATKKDSEGRLIAEVVPDKRLKPFEKGVLFLEVLLASETPLHEVCRHVGVVFKE